jgi:hypothetical protein
MRFLLLLCVQMGVVGYRAAMRTVARLSTTADATAARGARSCRNELRVTRLAFYRPRGCCSQGQTKSDRAAQGL